jgi:hypothetical protein
MYSFGRHGSEFDFFPMVRVGDDLQFVVHRCPPELGWIEVTGKLKAQKLVPFRFLRRSWLKQADHEAELEALYGDWKIRNPSWSYMDDPSIVSWEAWKNTDFDWIDGADA